MESGSNMESGSSTTQGDDGSSRGAMSMDEDEAERVADGHKEEGNDCFRQQRYGDAVACNTRAIQVYPKSPVYYCNR